MKSIVIFLNNEGIGTAEALKTVDNYCNCQDYCKKETLQTRLLAEELLGMMKGIIGGKEKFEADFWIEGAGKQCELHVAARTRIDSETREELLAVSNSGENIAARGVMGKIRQVVEGCLNGFEEANQFSAAGGALMYPHAGIYSGAMGCMVPVQIWSLQDYIDTVEKTKETDSEPWDELEKSIVAKLADDVLVGVQNKKVKIIVKKNFEKSQGINI